MTPRPAAAHGAGEQARRVEGRVTDRMACDAPRSQAGEDRQEPPFKHGLQQRPISALQQEADQSRAVHDGASEVILLAAAPAPRQTKWEPARTDSHGMKSIN